MIMAPLIILFVGYSIWVFRGTQQLKDFIDGVKIYFYCIFAVGSLLTMISLGGWWYVLIPTISLCFYTVKTIIKVITIAYKTNTHINKVKFN